MARRPTLGKPPILDDPNLCLGDRLSIRRNDLSPVGRRVRQYFINTEKAYFKLLEQSHADAKIIKELMDTLRAQGEQLQKLAALLKLQIPADEARLRGKGHVTAVP